MKLKLRSNKVAPRGESDKKKEKPQRASSIRAHATASQGILEAFGKRKKKKTSVEVQPQAEAVEVCEPEKEEVLSCVYCRQDFQNKNQYEDHCKYSFVHEINVRNHIRDEEMRKTEDERKDLLLKKIAIAKAKQRRMHVTHCTEKFFWRIPQTCKVIFAQNEIDQFCMHVFDPTNVVSIANETLIYSEREVKDSIRRVDHHYADENKVIPKERIYEKVLSCIEIAKDEEKGYSLIITGVTACCAEDMVGSDDFYDMFPFLEESKKKEHMISAIKPAVQFQATDEILQADKKSLQTACHEVQEILHETETVMEMLQSDKFSMKKLLREAHDLFGKKETKTESNLNVFERLTSNLRTKSRVLSIRFKKKSQQLADK